MINILKRRCDICNRRFSAENGYVIFREDRGYPFDDAGVVLTIEHARCGPDTGYYVELSRLLNDPDHWLNHLSPKRWFGSNCVEQWERKFGPISDVAKDVLTYRQACRSRIVYDRAIQHLKGQNEAP